ncbi:MAG TPA: GumC family protein [Candidatus Sulfotelmatobacter sp.]|nr:GumC family protein [Candidatus Sulfotelmatobacter sp.]
MNESISGYAHKPYSFTARDVVAIGFRHKKVMILCFIGVVVGVALSTLVLPTKYRAETKLLVKRERVDPVVSPDQNAPVTFHDTVSEEEINSEVEMLNSQDVLRQVVVSCGLDKKKWTAKYLHPWQTPANRTDKAVADLRSDLQLEVLKKTNVISIAYESKDPKLAQKVLATLDDAYLQKHLEVHHPSGQFQFFDQQSEQYKKNMMDAEAQLKQFATEQGGVAPSVLRDMTLQKLADFNSQMETTVASISETQTRIADLEKQSQSTPSRMTTSTKKSDNAQVLENLKSTLITLENKRTELLTKYQPTYPLVQEVDKELSDTRSALAKEESTPVKEEVTDQNPTYAWESSELAKAKADLAGFQARESALKSIINTYNAKVEQLEQQGIQQGDLTRSAKENEANYVLYTKKKEEARIEDALDRTRLLNVAVIQPPALPSIPTRSPALFALVAVLLASAVSVGVVFAIDYADQSFRTPSEVMAELRIPVLAAVPVHARGVHELYGETGNGNGNGHHDELTFDGGSDSTIIEERG